MEFAVEAQKLLSVSLEGSVGKRAEKTEKWTGERCSEIRNLQAGPWTAGS